MVQDHAPHFCGDGGRKKECKEAATLLSAISDILVRCVVKSLLCLCNHHVKLA